MFIQYYTYLYNQGDWTTSIILDLSPLHLYPFPSPHLKVPMSHNFLCEARGMHSESWVTNCAMNLLGTPPIIPKRSENQTCVIKALCCTEGGGSLATRHAGPHLSQQLRAWDRRPITRKLPLLQTSIHVAKSLGPWWTVRQFLLAQKYAGSSGKFRCATTR